MEQKKKWVRDNDILSSDMDGETVMMSIEKGKYFGLDKVGSRIWELLEEPHSTDELIKILMKEFDVEGAQCREDTQKFLDELIKQNLVKAT
jgi:hypothetical protein